jgi:hypothetical protein
MPQCEEADSKEGNRIPSCILYFSYLTRWFVKYILQEEVAILTKQMTLLLELQQKATSWLLLEILPPPSPRPHPPLQTQFNILK